MQINFSPSIKRYLSLSVIFLVVIIGIVIGKRVFVGYRNNLLPSKSASPAISTTPSVQSSRYSSLKQSIIQFNPSLPEPLPPQLQDEILY